MLLTSYLIFLLSLPVIKQDVFHHMTRNKKRGNEKRNVITDQLIVKLLQIDSLF